MNYGISFDFWNTLYAHGLEAKRHNLRKRYFKEQIPRFILIEDYQIDEAFEASINFFLYEWKYKFRTPTAHERIKFIAQRLHISLPTETIYQIADYFGKLIFKVPPQEILEIKNC